MFRKLMITAAFVGLTFVAFDASAQMRQEGAGGASMSTPSAGTSQGPVVRSSTHSVRKRHVKRHRRSTVGSSMSRGSRSGGGY